MADDLFSFENMNEDEGGGLSEDEYDALNDETFGGDGDEFDWEEEHEQLAHITESSRQSKDHLDLEASLSRLVLEEETPQPQRPQQALWPPMPHPPNSVSGLKNVVSVEDLERQLRQTQPQPQQNFFQPRFPPVILQRPPGLQAPVPLPFAPQQNLNHGLQLNQMNHNQMNQIMGHGNQMGNPMGPSNQMGQTNQMGVQNQMSHANQMIQGNQMPSGNQMGIGSQMSHGNQIGHNNQMGPGNQMAQNNHIGPNNQGPNNQMPNMQMGPNGQISINHMGQNNQINTQMGPSNHQMGPSSQMVSNQMGQNNQIGNQMAPNNQISNQMGPNNQMSNHMGPSNQVGNQMGPTGQMMNGNQFGMVPNQLPMIPPHLMGQPRMMGPPHSLNNAPPRQPFPNQGQFNPNFRGPMDNKQGVMINQQMSGPPGNQMQPFNQHGNQTHQSQQMFNQSSPQMHHLSQPQMQSQSNQMNQPQVSSQVMSQQNVNRPPDKKKPMQQRNLVFNNSNLSSQNLVQLIQSTHPMLQMHFHNASHHPVLNARFNQQAFMQRFNNNNNNRCADEEYERDSSDEYSGLMSQREKQWLLNIQMMQLNTGTPYIEDYYYTVWQDRRTRAQREGVKEAHKANQQNHPFYSGGKQESRERHRHNSTSEDQPTPRTYVPTQFENSLGKLQCGSVTAPRKIIDVEVVRETEASAAPSNRQSRAPSVASTTHPHDGPREVRRTKQCLLDIEALYLVLLRLEELNDPLAIANALVLRDREEKARLAEVARCEDEGVMPDANLFLRNIESVQRRGADSSEKTPDKRQVVSLTVSAEPLKQKNLLDESREELMGKIFAGLLFEDRLQTYLGIRKGKLLIERFLARVPSSHARLRTLWARILRALPAAARRDVRDESVLPRLAPAFRKYISNSNGWAAILEACAHLSEALDPARQPHALLSPFTLTAVTILMEKTSTHINTADATSNERQWTKFLKTLARTLKNTTIAVAKPTETLKKSDVQSHIRILESKSTVEILQRGKTTAEFADLSKNEFSEILVKHLC